MTIHTPGTPVRGIYCQDTRFRGVVLSSRQHSMNAQMYEVRVSTPDFTYQGQPRESLTLSVMFDGTACPWHAGYADSVEVIDEQ